MGKRPVLYAFITLLSISYTQTSLLIGSSKNDPTFTTEDMKSLTKAIDEIRGPLQAIANNTSYGYHASDVQEVQTAFNFWHGAYAFLASNDKILYERFIKPLHHSFTNSKKHALSEVNSMLQSVFHNNVMKLAGIGVATIALSVAALCGVPLAFRMIERRLTTPKLIIESSRKSIYQKIVNLFIEISVPYQLMIFNAALQERLNDVISITRIINQKVKQGEKNIKYRNLLLYGPPGTGKTMFAKKLAQESGMEYVYMSGSSFSKFEKGKGIEALDELFAWANKSKGLLIFIDEAETFLSKRENMDVQSEAYLLLNNFLNYTGQRSNKFMLVFATNHKDVLDSAMFSRIDDLVEVGLPEKNERAQLLKLYRDTVLLDRVNNEKTLVDSVEKHFNKATIDEIATTTEGLAGRDFDGIVNAIRTDAALLTPTQVTPTLIRTAVKRFVEKHKAFNNH